MSKNAAAHCSDVNWTMPRLLDEAGLASSISVEIDQTTERPYAFRIAGATFPLGNGQSGCANTRVIMDWRNTVWFDDASLAEVILIQHTLLGAGIELIHAPVPPSRGGPHSLDHEMQKLS